MGRAIALEVASRGSHVALADIDEADLTRSAELVRAASPNRRVTAEVVDVADRDAMVRFAERVVADHGSVNAIFNNAGVSVTDSAEHMSFDDFEWLMSINFWGVVNGTRAFLPHLKTVSQAHIVNTSSVFGLVAVPSQSAYNAAKFAVRGYTEALAQELAETQISVSCVIPGGVRTNIVKRSRYTARDNEAPTKGELIIKFERLAPLPAQAAARTIVDGVLKHRHQILVGRDARFLSWLVRLFPVRYPRILRLFNRS